MKLKRKIALLFASISLFSLGVGESINATHDLIKIYQGDFVDGKSTGKGMHTWANGDKYEGDWVNGNRTGKGTFNWVSGNKYVGDFLDILISNFYHFLIEFLNHRVLH